MKKMPIMYFTLCYNRFANLLGKVWAKGAGKLSFLKSVAKFWKNFFTLHKQKTTTNEDVSLFQLNNKKQPLTSQQRRELIIKSGLTRSAFGASQGLPPEYFEPSD